MRIRTTTDLPAVVFAVALLLSLAVPLYAQDPLPSEASRALRVFFECTGGNACDQREFRTEIDWVNWMRDRRDAQLHIIVTGQDTGSGGRNYVLDFIGLQELEGFDDQLNFTTLGTDVRDETVRGLRRVLTVGIARYSLLLDITPPIDLVRAGGGGDLRDRLVTSDQVEDPWDFWVFELDVGLDMSGETSRSNRRVNGGFEASRVTTTWKFDIGADGNWRRSEIELSDSTIIDNRRDWDVETNLVYSLAERWSLGGRAEVSAATLTNQDLSVSVGPQIEYSVWPYEESPRRSLRVRYSLGARHFEYEEETLFGYLSETRPVQDLRVFFGRRAPWGNAFTNFTYTQFLHDLGKYRVSTGGRVSFRILRGLNLNVNGDVSWIRDQLFLSAEGASDEEILLQRRRVASNFDWEFDVGFSFQFGSIYNNVVNNRF